MRRALLFLLAAMATEDCDPASVPDPAPAIAAAPPAPTEISVEVYDRRETSMRVCWTNPADVDGGPLRARYELRYAKRPITSAALFDDDRVSLPAPVPPPGAPGTRTCVIVHNLYIENGYYFAVRSVRGADPPHPPQEEPST